MNINTILSECDRVDLIQGDDELIQFYCTKLDEYDISTPDELKNVSEFFVSLSEEWIEELDPDDMLTIYEEVCETYDDPKKINLHFLHKFINEKMKRVVRAGKVVRKLVHRDGYKVVDGKYVKMSSSEKMKRSKASKKGAKKKKGHQSAINRSRKKSMKKASRL